MQHAIDAEAHLSCVAARLEVDVRGALIECVLPQPVDDVDDVLVVGVDAAARAQLDQLIDAASAGIRELNAIQLAAVK